MGIQMGRKSRRSRSVYDPSISDGIERSHGPERINVDALTMQSLMEEATQEELSDRLQQENNKACKRRCWLIAAAFLIIVIVVIIAACAGKKGPSSTNARLPPPPSDIASKCTVKKVKTRKGEIACKVDCEIADCCHYPTSLGLSCLEGNEDTCLEYHGHCSILQGNLTRAQAFNASNLTLSPANIATLCSSESLSTEDGLHECTQVCEIGECCWQVGVPSCTSSPQCHTFASCLLLRAHVQYEAQKKRGSS